MIWFYSPGEYKKIRPWRGGFLGVLPGGWEGKELGSHFALTHSFIPHIQYLFRATYLSGLLGLLVGIQLGTSQTQVLPSGSFQSRRAVRQYTSITSLHPQSPTPGPTIRHRNPAGSPSISRSHVEAATALQQAGDASPFPSLVTCSPPCCWEPVHQSANRRGN